MALYNLLILLSVAISNRTSPGVDSPPAHAIYVSVIEIVQLPGDSASMRIKVFSDDLLDAIQHEHALQSAISEDAICHTYSGLVQDYFANHIDLRINERHADFTLISCKTQGGAHWLAFAADTPGRWSEVEVTVGYFYELFPTQSNVLTLRANGNIWTQRFNKKYQTRLFDISR